MWTLSRSGEQTTRRPNCLAGQPGFEPQHAICSEYARRAWRVSLPSCEQKKPVDLHQRSEGIETFEIGHPRLPSPPADRVSWPYAESCKEAVPVFGCHPHHERVIFVEERLADRVTLIVVPSAGEDEEFSFKVSQPGRPFGQQRLTRFKLCRGDRRFQLRRSLPPLDGDIDISRLV